jgi:signal transduction histidine kinase
VLDALVAIVVTLVAVSGSVGEAHPTVHATVSQIHWLKTHQPGAAYALIVVSGASLLFRRRWPLAVLTVTVAATAAYAAPGYVPGAALCPVYVALFTVAMLRPRHVVRWVGLASIAVLFVATGVNSVFGWLGGTNVLMVALSVASLALGQAVAGRRQVFAAMVERAERAERDREEEARRRVDAERLRIARELHDVVAHSMSMINVQAGVAAHVLSSQPEQAAEALIAIKTASREGLRELRAILNVLRQVDEEEAGRIPAPKLAQLDALADATTQAGLPTTVSMSGSPAGLAPTVELAAYRIVQESLTNVLRHAGPDARAAVQIVISDDAVSVQVDDDGRGVTSPAPGAADFHDGTGAGLAGMRERAAAFGGTLEAGPRPGRGWRVRALLPRPATGAAAGPDGATAGARPGAGNGTHVSGRPV